MSSPLISSVIERKARCPTPSIDRRRFSRRFGADPAATLEGIDESVREFQRSAKKQALLDRSGNEAAGLLGAQVPNVHEDEGPVVFDRRYR